MLYLSSKIILRSISCLILLLFYSQITVAASITWSGGNGNWHIGANWSSGSIPTANDDVSIPTGNVAILTNANALAKSLRIGTSASLTVQINSTLRIAGTTNSSGINNNGILTTSGDIQVSNISGSAQHGVLNNGQFINNGRISIAVVRNGYGIKCAVGATFQNDGSISFSQISSHCIFNEGDFLNTRDISIANTAGDGVLNATTGRFVNSGQLAVSPKYSCLLNSGRFDNQSSGQISLNGNNIDMNFSGILNYSGNQTFTNQGIITITNCQYNIFISSGELVNSGKIYSLDAKSAGLKISTNGVLRNNAELWVRDGLANGINVEGFLVNNRYGSIFVLDNGDDGLFVVSNTLNTGELLNFGNLNIQTSGLRSIVNHGLIDNKARGSLSITDQVVGESGSTLINRGHFYSNFSGQHVNNGATITNSAVIGDPTRSFDGIFTNQRLRIIPIAGPLLSGQPVVNALDKVSVSGLTIGSWRNLITGDIVGTYNASSNVFMPNNNAVGLTEIAVNIRINSTGNWGYYRIPISGGVQPLMASTTTDLPALYQGREQNENIPSNSPSISRAEFKIYPNPVGQYLFIETARPALENVNVVLFNLLGQEVYRQEVEFLEAKMNMEIPSGLVNGNYLLTIWRNDLLIHSEQVHLVSGRKPFYRY